MSKSACQWPQDSPPQKYCVASMWKGREDIGGGGRKEPSHHYLVALLMFCVVVVCAINTRRFVLRLVFDCVNYLLAPFYHMHQVMRDTSFFYTCWRLVLHCCLLSRQAIVPWHLLAYIPGYYDCHKDHTQPDFFFLFSTPIITQHARRHSSSSCWTLCRFGLSSLAPTDHWQTRVSQRSKTLGTANSLRCTRCTGIYTPIFPHIVSRMYNTVINIVFCTSMRSKTYHAYQVHYIYTCYFFFVSHKHQSFFPKPIAPDNLERCYYFFCSVAVMVELARLKSPTSDSSDY